MTEVARAGVFYLLSRITFPVLSPLLLTLDIVTVAVGSSAIILCVLQMLPLIMTHPFLIMSHLVSSYGNVILLGDFNVPDIDWDTLTGVSLFSKSLCNIVFHDNLSQLVHSPN